jgi:glucose-6-phosphate 1-dehydrogenase
MATLTPDGAHRRPDPHVIVLFGASGDLARRKLLPGLCHLAQAGLMPEQFRIIGTSRTERSDDEFRAMARDVVCKGTPEAGVDEFLSNLSFAPFRADQPGPLQEAVDRAERELGGEPRRLLYLSIPPGAFEEFVVALGDAGMADGARVIVEKPFGRDLESARRLNAVVHDVVPEERVFRIDHFLGREAVQNLLALRFANGMFEPVWNRDHIDHVQIDVPETLAVDMRAGFYEDTGAFRDMVVTHLFHVLGFVAMEPPTSLEAGQLNEETSKVFRSVAPITPDDIVRGQYDGYREEPGVAPHSRTETFVAVRATIENWRWTGVPFFLRTGKRLAEQRRLLTIAFREPPRLMFDVANALVDDPGPDNISFDLGDPGGIVSSFLAKVPGPTMRLGRARMSFSYREAFESARPLEAYERLLYDAMLGDRTLFTDAPGIENLWAAAAPVLEAHLPLHRYTPGSWGPDAMHQLIAPRRWRLPERYVLG